MMLLECLRKIIADRCLALPDTDDTVVIEEADVMQVEVVGFPPGAIMMRLDRCIGEWSGLKDGLWEKLCGYMMIYSSEGKNRAVLIELKRTIRDSREGAEGVEQLRRSLPALDYLHSVCRIDSGMHAKARKSDLPVRYVLIGKRSSLRLDKQRVRPGAAFSQETHQGIDVNFCLRYRINFAEFAGLHDG